MTRKTNKILFLLVGIIFQSTQVAKCAKRWSKDQCHEIINSFEKSRSNDNQKIDFIKEFLGKNQGLKNNIEEVLPSSKKTAVTLTQTEGKIFIFLRSLFLYWRAAKDKALIGPTSLLKATKGSTLFKDIDAFEQCFLLFKKEKFFGKIAKYMRTKEQRVFEPDFLQWCSNKNSSLRDQHFDVTVNPKSGGCKLFTQDLMQAKRDEFFKFFDLYGTNSDSKANKDFLSVLIEDLLKEDEKKLVKKVFKSTASKASQQSGFLLASFFSCTYVYFQLKKDGCITQCNNLIPISNTKKIDSFNLFEKIYDQLKKEKILHKILNSKEFEGAFSSEGTIYSQFKSFLIDSRKIDFSQFHSNSSTMLRLKQPRFPVQQKKLAGNGNEDNEILRTPFTLRRKRKLSDCYDSLAEQTDHESDLS